MEITINETRYEFRETKRELEPYFNGVSLIEVEGVILKDGKEILPYENYWGPNDDISHYHFENGDDTFGMKGKPNFPTEIALEVILRILNK